MPATARTMSSAIGSALLALSLVSAGASGANAQQAAPRPQTETSASGTARTINLGVGRSLILDLPRDAAEIFVGDPKVVNAVVRSARKV